jgi:hypothetical protein
VLLECQFRELRNEVIAGSKEIQMRKILLSIDETQWHGWRGGGSTTTTSTVTIAENSNLVLQNWHTNYVFQITLCQDDELEMLPIGESPAPCNSNGGINLLGSVETTILRKGQSLRMATPTMDSGIIWKVTLLDIIPNDEEDARNSPQ